MSARTITITRKGTIVVLHGWKVAQLARQAGLKPMYAGTVQGWMLDAHKLPDLVGWLEYRNVRYELADGTPRPSTSVRSADPESAADSLSQDSLW